MTPTEKAKAFMAANDKSPVVIGAAIGNGGQGGQGGHYTLKDKQSFRLSVEDCQSLPEGYPRWNHKGMN